MAYKTGHDFDIRKKKQHFFVCQMSQLPCVCGCIKFDVFCFLAAAQTYKMGVLTKPTKTITFDDHHFLSCHNNMKKHLFQMKHTYFKRFIY